MNPGDHYRAIYTTLWRLDRRHYRCAITRPANDQRIIARFHDALNTPGGEHDHA